MKNCILEKRIDRSRELLEVAPTVPSEPVVPVLDDAGFLPDYSLPENHVEIEDLEYVNDLEKPCPRTMIANTPWAAHFPPLAQSLTPFVKK